MTEAEKLGRIQLQATTAAYFRLREENRKLRRAVWLLAVAGTAMWIVAFF